MFTTDEVKVLDLAASIIENKIRISNFLTNPDLTRDFLKMKMCHLEHEIFGIIFLDSQHNVIEFKEIFRGTIDSASVYPREVLKEVLAVNAAAVILAHNHPSGIPEPSEADKRITERLKNALKCIDVPVLDHMVVGLNEVVSFAERGWL